MHSHPQTYSERRRSINWISARFYADLAAAVRPPRAEVRALAEEVDGVVTVHVLGTDEYMDLETFEQRYPEGYISHWYILEFDGYEGDEAVEAGSDGGGVGQTF